MAGIGRLEHHVGELLAYLERNQGALVHYAARRRNGEPISTAFVESAVNEIIAKRTRYVGGHRPRPAVTRQAAGPRRCDRPMVRR
jgi:hypothetical protein